MGHKDAKLSKAEYKLTNLRFPPSASEFNEHVDEFSRKSEFDRWCKDSAKKHVILRAADWEINLATRRVDGGHGVISGPGKGVDGVLDTVLPRISDQRNYLMHASSQGSNFSVYGRARGVENHHPSHRPFQKYSFSVVQGYAKEEKIINRFGNINAPKTFSTGT